MNTKMKKLRQSIDRIDRQLIRALLARTRIAHAIWKEKKKESLPLDDPKREKKLLSHCKAAVRPPLALEDIEAFRILLIQISKNTILRKISRGKVRVYKDRSAQRKKLGLR